MNLFSADLNSLSFTHLEEFLAVKGPEEQRPSEGVQVVYQRHKIWGELRLQIGKERPEPSWEFRRLIVFVYRVRTGAA